MRLVVEYSEGDGCTYSCTVTKPVEYESPEAFIVEFEEFAKKEYKNFDFCYPPTFAGVTWDLSGIFERGKYFAPNVYTVDEWFAQHLLN